MIFRFFLLFLTFITTEIYSQSSNLQIIDMKIGNGKEAKKGNNLKVHYTGWLSSNNKKFDSSLDRKQPFEFKLGRDQVISGWNRGILGMKEGGKRKLIIPPELGYGENGSGNSIPPNSTLIFEVELLEVD